ncbi:MAG: endolytic transglycosylase MltG [Deltaproteobacteria bacterium]|nr:endolytic transglycosylase MltG [Deltaproteobacteria bacterium]
MKKLVVALTAVVVLALIAVGVFVLFLERALDRPGAGQGSVVLTVPRGAHAKAVGRLLKGAGLIDDEGAWRYLVRRRGGLRVKAGRFELDRASSMRELAAALEQNPLPEDVPFKVLEGWRLSDTDRALAEKGWIKPGAYVALASTPDSFKAPFELPRATLEGYLYPETYAVVPDPFDLKGLIQRQLDTFGERFYRQHQQEIASGKRSLHEIVTMASLLEREEPTPAQRSLVAGILYRRLDTDTPLGVDATSRYQLVDWNDRAAFLQRLRDQSDPYNSRYQKGLPPTPIGAPTVESLLAALRPTRSEYWYYLHDSNKVLHPSRNAAEHEALRKQYNVY